MNKSKESKSDTVDKMKPETQKLLFHINRKIEAKEADLECPICFEVSSPPIYSCDEQHIICSDCRPKVGVHFRSNNFFFFSGLYLPGVQGTLPNETAETSLC